MHVRIFLAGFAFLFATAFGQQPSPQERDPNVMITFHGGSGSQLLSRCQAAMKIGTGKITVAIKDIQELLDGSFCRAYVIGVADTLVAVSANSRTTYCVPANADVDQLVRAVVKYLSDNPAKLNSPAGGLVTNAMVEAFPCP